MPRIDVALRHQQALAELSQLRAQAETLEARHREGEAAVAALGARDALYCLGTPAFIKVTGNTAVKLLVDEGRRVWEQMEEVQRDIVRLERRVQELEEEAAKPHEEE